MTMIGLSNRVVIAGGGLAAVQAVQALREVQLRGSIVMSPPRVDTNICFIGERR